MCCWPSGCGLADNSHEAVKRVRALPKVIKEAISEHWVCRRSDKRTEEWLCHQTTVTNRIEAKSDRIYGAIGHVHGIESSNQGVESSSHAC